MASDFESWAHSALQSISRGVNLTAPAPNQSLFKYISLSSEKSWQMLQETIRTRTLEGSAAELLNDPFEVSPTIFNDLRNPSLIREQAGLRRLIPDLEEPDNQLDSKDKAAKIALEYFRSIQSETRVISFSERYDSPLLWAHYANNYRGACLHFLGGKMQGPFTYNLAKVQYTDRRPVYPLSLALTLAQQTPTSFTSIDPSYEAARAENDKICYFTKALDWEYEKEIRKVYPTSRQKRMAFDATSFVSIICGPRMNIEDKSRLAAILGESEFSHIPILDAKVSNSSFSIAVDWSSSD